LSTSLALTLQNVRQARSFSVFAVLDEIAALEGLPLRASQTKAATKFRGKVIGRYMHKHFTTPRNLPGNLCNHWMGGYAEKHGVLAKQIEEVIPVGTVYHTEAEAWSVAGKLAYELVVEARRKRCERQAMTGEWIVYYVHEGRNYYLDLASHEELRTMGEQALYDRLNDACAWEFPFAFA